GKVYKPEKIEQALTNFFRRGNLSTLRELALRAVAEEVGSKANQYRAREGLEPAPIPEKVMVCMSASPGAKRLVRAGARIAGRLGTVWYAVYVETPHEAKGNNSAESAKHLGENIELAQELGATVVKLKGRRASDGLIDFAHREGITHVIFGQSARTRWDVLLHGSVLNRFLSEIKDAAVQVMPLEKPDKRRSR
ncbi:MAG: universal stress protein, partial [Blastocatellia bacterium]